MSIVTGIRSVSLYRARALARQMVAPPARRTSIRSISASDGRAVGGTCHAKPARRRPCHVARRAGAWRVPQRPGAVGRPGALRVKVMVVCRSSASFWEMCRPRPVPSWLALAVGAAAFEGAEDPGLVGCGDARGGRLQGLDDVLRDPAAVDRFQGDLHLAGSDLREVEQVVADRQQVLDRWSGPGAADVPARRSGEAFVGLPGGQGDLDRELAAVPAQPGHLQPAPIARVTGSAR